MKFHDIFVYSSKGLYMYFINTYFILIITRMVCTKISDKVERIVLGLLKTKHSYRSIQKEVKSLGFSISFRTIKNIRDNVGLQRQCANAGKPMPQIRRRTSVATPAVIRKVKNMIAKVNPPTQREMASKLGVSRGSVQHIIKNILETRLKKKCKVHQLNFKQIQMRHT